MPLQPLQQSGVNLSSQVTQCHSHNLLKVHNLPSLPLQQPAVHPPRPPGHLQRPMQTTAPGSLGPSFPHGQPPLPSRLPPQPLYQIELEASKQREATLEAALAEKEFTEEECRKKVDEAKKREASLENDLANMWVLVTKLKKEGGAIPNSKSRGCHRGMMSRPFLHQPQTLVMQEPNLLTDLLGPQDLWLVTRFPSHWGSFP
ncbi:hypothetical protein Ancab_028328 [Ancistrocladus abbreviatus]